MNIANDDDPLLLGPVQIQCGMYDRRKRKPCTERRPSGEEALQMLNHPSMAYSSKGPQCQISRCSRVLAQGSG